MHRRNVITGAPAAVFAMAIAPTALRAETRAVREFQVLRAGRDIGRHRLTATADGSGFALDIEIDLVVRVLGIAAYRYEMRVEERWAGGALQRFESQTNDDGDDDFARIERQGDMLQIEGSKFSGTQPGEAAMTTYFARPLLERRPWISSQSGAPVSIDPRPAPGEAGAFEMRGDLGNVLIYDEAGDWIGCRFDAGGEPAEYSLTETSGSIAALWQSMT